MPGAIWIFALITFVSTMAGGLIALRFKHVLHYFFAFAAGSLIAVAFFSMLPESLEMAASVGMSTKTVMAVIVFSFLSFSFVEKYFLIHHHHDNSEHGHIMGIFGAGSLICHSFLDGVAIGAAYHVSFTTGLIVALAVIAHDFTDGMNTVVLMLKNQHSPKKAKLFLLADALAPVMGVVLTSMIFIPARALAILLAVFVGEFIYIGAATLLPETAHHKSWKVILCMLAGALVFFFIT
ncbi:MAG: ZIP family metal transporter [Deltaproteobacteria bacterium]|nr:ZIP family metal transporter [Deltaproteobacteria bacterium]